jgi:hypothetical protein
MTMTVHLSSKNMLSVIAGVFVVTLALIPLLVPADHLSWPMWKAAIIVCAAVAVFALLAQAVLQSQEDKARDEREKGRDARERERDGLLGEIRNQLSGISQKSVEQRMDIVSTLGPKLALDWRKEWKEMESKFRKMGDSSIFADQPDQDNSSAWEIRSDKKTAKVEECKALCELAGSKLLASSPAIELSGAVQSSDANWKRWLEFLKEDQGFTQCYLISGKRPGGKSSTTQAGYIYNLPEASAIACIKCVATTYAKQLE